MSKKTLEKTITMNREDAKAWLKALRSGEYSQTTSELCNSQGYCCLGVLQDALGRVQEGRALPTRRWLKSHNISIKEDQEYEAGRNQEVDIALDENNSTGYNTVASLNDSKQFNFKQIADVLEKHIKMV